MAPRLGAIDPVLREYAKLAARYDRRWSFYIEATIRETLRRLDPRPGEGMLDLGCGTGALLHMLSLGFPQTALAGIDPSPEMVDIARTRLGPSIRLVQGGAEDLPFRDDAFHIVVSTSVFHFLRRPDRALREIGRVLAPGGRVVITDWCHDFLACRVCDAVLHVFDRDHLAAYSGQDLVRMIQESGFESVTNERYKINWMWGMMTARATAPAPDHNSSPPGATRGS